MCRASDVMLLNQQSHFGANLDRMLSARRWRWCARIHQTCMLLLHSCRCAMLVLVVEMQPCCVYYIASLQRCCVFGVAVVVQWLGSGSVGLVPIEMCWSAVANVRLCISMCGKPNARTASHHQSRTFGVFFLSSSRFGITVMSIESNNASTSAGVQSGMEWCICMPACLV
jgi:hypothetical protein